MWLFLLHSFLHQEFTEAWPCTFYWNLFLFIWEQQGGCPCTLWTEELQPGLQRCSRAQDNHTHPQFNPLNVAYHTETKWPPTPRVRQRPLKAVGLLFPDNNILRSTASSGFRATLMTGFQHGIALLCVQLKPIVFEQLQFYGWFGSINSTDGTALRFTAPERHQGYDKKFQLFNCKLI